MSKYKAILLELCRTALNLPAGELTELETKTEEELNETEVGTKIKEHYRSIIGSINKTADLKLDEKFKAGQRKKAEEFEKLLKEKFSVESELQGDELVDEIFAGVSSKPGDKAKELTPDDVKKHPEYVRMETDFKKQLKTEKETAQKSITELKAQYQGKEVFAKVAAKAIEIFEAMKPVLSDDPKKAAAQKQVLLDRLQGYQYEEVEGKFIVSKDGKVVENTFGHKAEFEDLVKEIGETYFDFRKAEDRESPNGDKAKQKQDDSKNKSTYTGKFPKDESEYLKMQNDSNIPLKDRIAINDYWEKQTASV